MRRSPLLTLAVLAAFVSMISSAAAQTATGQITGTVRDATGAVMSGVKVVVTNQQTGLTRETKTGANGDYVLPLLPAGIYSVTGEQTGFKTAIHTDVGLSVDQIQRLDMQLAPGNVTETVEVQSNALALDTGSASVGHTITEKQVTELPLNGRNFLQLLFLGAGAVEIGGEQGAMRQGVGNAISIMGARPTSNNFMIDGTANIDTSLGTPAAVLSVDAIQEFKEQTTTYSAEYGFSSNQVNLVSKTGTNALRGTAFGFFRNDAWDARNFFDDKTSPAPKLDQKQFGFVVGGPVMFPGYDGRNRTFFLANYEGTRIDRGATNFYTVPTPEQLAGRFSTTIVDPATGAAFANNTIPQSRFSRLAQLAIRNNWFPAPNSSAPQGNYQAVRTFPQVQDQFTLRGDQDLAKFGRAFFRYTKTTYENRTAGSVIDAGDRVFVQDTNNWQISHSWPIKNTLVNQFRIGRVDARADQKGIPCPQGDVDFLGVTGTFTDIPDDQRECPSIGMTGFSGTGGAVNAYSASNQPMWDISNTSTWVGGQPHAELRLQLPPLVAAARSRHRIPRQLRVQRRLQRRSRRRHAARVLLGRRHLPAGGVQRAGSGGQSARVQLQVLRAVLPGRLAGQFATDRESRPALGLPQRPLRNAQPHGVAEPRLRGPAGCSWPTSRWSKAASSTARTTRYAGRRSPENPDRFKVFAPRLGFAWRPLGEETVIRGGYGVFFDSAEGREIDGAADVYPYVSRGNYIQSVGQPTPFQTTDTLFPSFAAPGVATPAANTFLAVSQSPEPRNPYMQQWSIGVQHEIAAAHDAGTQLHRHARFEPADAAQHRAGASVRPGQPLVGGCPQAVPELRRLHRQRLERAIELQRAQHQAGAPRTRRDFHARLHVGEEHRPQVGGRGDRGERLQRLAGLPGQRRSRTRLRALGFRRRSPAGWQLRLQPAVRQRRKVRRERHRREERGCRRLAGQRHLYLAAGLSDHHHGRRCRRPERHLRHQSRRSGRRPERRQADRGPVVQHVGVCTTGGRRARQPRAEHRTRARA